ncbi:hypothetical protein GCM10009830_19400 [Glycomyces endophyticus]|uniref:Uncharacterized protein n=1 Tax=Glycomyces endophyticus TaxID=480996 RepID=A0ABN2GM20_9ACTN
MSVETRAWTPLITFETVAGLTPASEAMSFNVGGKAGSLRGGSVRRGRSPPRIATLTSVTSTDTLSAKV